MLKRLSSQETLLVLDQVFFSLTSLLTTSLAARSLNHDAFGAFALMLICAGFLWMLAFNSILLPAVATSTESNRSAQTLMAGCVAVILVASPVAIAVLLRRASWSLGEALTLILLYPLYECAKKIIALQNRAQWNILLSSAFTSILLTGCELHVPFQDVILIAYSATSIAGLVLVNAIARRSNWSVAELKGLASRGAAANTCFAASTSIGTQLHIFLASYLLTNFAVALMRAGQALSSVIGPVIQMLEIRLPKNLDNPKYVALSFATMYVPGVALAILLLCFWDQIASLVFGQQYVPYKTEILTAYSATFLIPISQFQRIRIRATGRYRPLVFGGIVGSALSALATSILIATCGMGGAMLSLPVSQLCFITSIQVSFALSRDIP